MRYDEAGPGRLLRRVDGRWQPVGPVLPPVEDDDLHEPELTEGALVYWHFPTAVEAETGDVLLVRERAVAEGVVVRQPEGPVVLAVEARAVTVEELADRGGRGRRRARGRGARGAAGLDDL